MEDATIADSFLKSLQRAIASGRNIFTLRGLFGYTSGSTVTQATSKVTAFTLDTVTGRIILAAGALAAWTSSSATWTNSFLGSYDTVQLNQDSGTLGAYNATVVAGAGTGQFVIYNNSSTSLNEAVAFRFTILRGSQS